MPGLADTLVAKPWRMRLGAFVLAACALLFARLVAPDGFTNIDERGGAALWRLAATHAADAAHGDNSTVDGVPTNRGQAERRVVIVDIDEASLARIGPWPWSRDRMAELARRLGEMGAGVLVFDVAFPDARPGDRRFAEQLARQPAVLAQAFSLTASPAAAGHLQGALQTPGCGQPFPAVGGFIGNAPDLIAGAGHIVPRIAADGAVRQLPAIVCHDNRAYPALGIAALLAAAGAPPALTLEPGAGWLDPAWRLTHPALPGIVVPLDGHGDVRIPYRLPREAFVSVSAGDILEGRAPAHLFQGAWVLIGATAFGLGDVVPTPFGGAVGGLEVHAQFMIGLLDGLPYTPQGATLVALLLGAGGAALLLLLFAAPAATGGARTRLPVWGLPLGALLLAATLFGLHAWLLLWQNLWLGWSAPAAFILVAGLLLAIFEHARTRLERGRLYDNLAAYLPAPVAADIAFRELSGAIVAERREITVLFADIRNFSAYCEGRPPEETAGLLHVFFATAARIVEAHGGLVEEFVGDAVMAVWNAPTPCPDHAARAYAAAQQLLEESQHLFSDTPPPGLEPLALGIGLETGPALVGSFGPARRRTHAALGETVTVAARLVAMTGDLAQPLLVGERAAAALISAAPPASPPLISLGDFLLEGLRRPRTLHAPVASVDTPACKILKFAS